jgi:hypothetical protein
MHIMLTEREDRQLEEMAERLGVTRSKLIRDRLFGESSAGRTGGSSERDSGTPGDPAAPAPTRSDYRITVNENLSSQEVLRCASQRQHASVFFSGCGPVRASREST